jgi:hypothetical protein
MERTREFEPGELAAAAEFIREVAKTHPRVYVEKRQGVGGWELVYGNDAAQAAEHLPKLSLFTRFRIRSTRL